MTSDESWSDVCDIRPHGPPSQVVRRRHQVTGQAHTFHLTIARAPDHTAPGVERSECLPVWEVRGYTSQVIVHFLHKGLQLLYEKGDRRRVSPAHVAKVERILARLDEATGPTGMDLPGFRLHPLKGDLTGYWSVAVSANWRIVFRFEGADARDVDLVDYH